MPRYGKHTSTTHADRRREFLIRTQDATVPADNARPQPAPEADELEQQCREHPDDYHSEK